MAITDEDLREISTVLNGELMSLGLYAQDTTVGIPPPQAQAHGTQPVIQIVCAIGDIAWAPRTQDPAARVAEAEELVNKAIDTRIDAFRAAQDLVSLDLDDDDPEP